MDKKAAIKRHDFRDVREEARGGKGFCASRYGVEKEQKHRAVASAVSKLKDGENGFGVEVVSASKVRRANLTEAVRPPK